MAKSWPVPNSTEARKIPSVLMVFGATGDLMARKLAPALLHLHKKNLCPEKFRVVGVSRRGLSDADFKANLKQSLKKHASSATLADVEKFLEITKYVQGNFNSLPDYKNLNKELKKIDDSWKICTNKLFYLAVPPNLYSTIFKNLDKSGLTEPCSPTQGWTRILVEKPFGSDLEQAISLDKQLLKIFKEEQVYRVDHYLGKEMLQNILTFRFSNNFLENVWNHQSIERVDIKLLERIDVEGRGAFYDGVGALLDVGQNHLLQMLALVAMENPVLFDANQIRSRRGEAIENILPIKNIKTQTVRGQYSGYKNEKGVNKNSQTETYFRLKTQLKSPEWHDVDFYLEAGKKLEEDLKEVIVTFTHPTPCLCPPGNHLKNQVIFRVQPNPGIFIRFWAKKPGSKYELEEKNLEFKYKAPRNERYLAEYTQLLLDAISGDQTLFVSGKEAIASWKFIDPVVKSWQSNKFPDLVEYGSSADVNRLAAQLEDIITDKLKREISIIGLGKMGKNIGLRLFERGWDVRGFDVNPKIEAPYAVYKTLDELLKKHTKPRLVWLMLPHHAIDKTLFSKAGLADKLKRGDIVIDGGNSYFKDSLKRAQKLESMGIKFIDVGVSGGPEGALKGASLMVGGSKKLFRELEPLWKHLATAGGYEHFEGTGAGHFVKMVHNGIEYGMMQAIAEGFTLLRAADYKIDLSAAAEVYNHGSVIESRLINWLAQAFTLHGVELSGVNSKVGHSGEAAWSVKTAKKNKVKTKIIKSALEFRKASAKKPSYTGKVLSSLREQFGGHSVD